MDTKNAQGQEHHGTALKGGRPTAPSNRPAWYSAVDERLDDLNTEGIACGRVARHLAAGARPG